MNANRSFVKKTKGGRVMKVVREHYLRDDIFVGCELAAPEHRGPDPSSWKLSPSADKYVVIDTNVALHQLDLLAHAAVTDVVVLSVVLEECRARSKASYDRLRALCQDPAKRFFVFANEHHRDTYVKTEAGESPNDRNDRAIRVATKFYARALPGKRVVLLTNDRGNLARAKAEGVDAVHARAFAAEHAASAPDMADLVARAAFDDDDAEPASDAAAAEPARPSKRAKTDVRGAAAAGSGAAFAPFEEHLAPSVVAAGVKGGTLHQGAMRTSRFSPWEGRVGSDAVGADILVVGRSAMNRAVDGDVVAVRLLPESEWRAPSAESPSSSGDEDAASAIGRLAPATAEEDEENEGGATNAAAAAAGSASGKVPAGVVVAIVRRAWRERGYAASIDLGPGAAGAAALAAAAEDTTAAARATRVLAVPLDRRLPKVRISTRQAAALADQRIVVVVDSWPRDSPYPEGHYVRSLGKLGDADAETAAVLLEADVDDRPFAPAVHACVPPLPWSFDEREHLERQPHREDLRSLRVCSVDPPGCRDIDDALSCRALDPEGKFLELGVHIADVTSFLKPDTAMDLEARRRGTTTYLVQRRLDMLPKPLTEDICSLRGGVERLTFSVFFRFDAATGLPAPNVAPRFVKGVIKSDAALTYAEAQTMMDDADDDSPLANDLRRINRCARALRARRVEAGALTLASPEVRFELDKETSNPLDVGMYVTREANQMVEEMMLLANVASAEAILRAFPSHALLRRHPTPAERMFEPLLRACRAAGVAVDVGSSRALADSLDAAVRDDDPYFNTLLRIVATRCMSQAVYCVSGQHASPERRHYGLAAPLYTHFTSPIRRYADVVVHRLLNAALGLEKPDDTLRDTDAMRAVADNINVRHRNSQMAARASVELHTHIFFRKRAAETDARVIRVRANGIVVFVPKFGIEAPIVFDEEGEGAGVDEGGSSARAKCSLDEDAMTLTTPAGKTWKIFDALRVRVEIEELPARRSRLAIRVIE